MKISMQFFCFALLIGALWACKTTPDQQTTFIQTDNEFSLKRAAGGSSGMEQIGDNSFVLVYDLKVFEDGPRLAQLVVSESGLSVSPILVDKWDMSGKASDLEAISSIPGRENEFMVAESGDWQGDYGRLFHLKIDFEQSKAVVLQSIQLPVFTSNTPETTGDQYEAIACLPYSLEQIIILLGERGGSTANKHGRIRWGLYHLETMQFQFTPEGKNGLPVELPAEIHTNQLRSITDFYVDKSGTIWSAACEDSGDYGPFRSLVYQLGSVQENNIEQPVLLNSDFDHLLYLPALKIEALAGPVNLMNYNLSIGTEDENYGGIWRPVQFIKFP